MLRFASIFLVLLASACATAPRPTPAPRAASELSASETSVWRGYLDSLDAFLRVPAARQRGLAVLEVRARLAENLARFTSSRVELSRPLAVRAGHLLARLDALFSVVSTSEPYAAAETLPPMPTLKLRPPVRGGDGELVLEPVDDEVTARARAAAEAATDDDPRPSLAPPPGSLVSEAEIDDGGPAIDVVPPPPEPGSVLRWPLAGARVTSGFGYRRDPIHRRIGFHDGVDLSAPRGAVVLSAAAGRVVFSGRRGGAGNSVILEHDNGTKTSYSHLDRCIVPPGANVPAGEAIGLVGSTGRSTGPHLHFVVSMNGKLVNPLRVVGRTAKELAALLPDY